MPGRSRIRGTTAALVNAGTRAVGGGLGSSWRGRARGGSGPLTLAWRRAGPAAVRLGCGGCSALGADGAGGADLAGGGVVGVARCGSRGGAERCGTVRNGACQVGRRIATGGGVGSS